MVNEIGYAHEGHSDYKIQRLIEDLLRSSFTNHYGPNNILDLINISRNLHFVKSNLQHYEK
jgi:hypothetical protein